MPFRIQNDATGIQSILNTLEVDRRSRGERFRNSEQLLGEVFFLPVPHIGAIKNLPCAQPILDRFRVGSIDIVMRPQSSQLVVASE
jgi:hypothetical protein